MTGLIILVILALVPTRVAAQEHVNPALGLLIGTVELRINAPGADTAQWYSGHVVQAQGGCTWFHLDHWAWVRHHLVHRDSVPRRLTVLVSLRSVIALRVLPAGAAPSDSSAWIPINSDDVRKGESARCLKGVR